MEAVQHVAGVSQVGVDGGACRPWSRRNDDDFDSLAPSVALLHQKRRQRSRVAVLDHRQGLAGVAVDDHGHIAVPLAHRGLIDQKHPAPAAAAVLGHQIRPGLDHTVDQMPAEVMAPCRRPQRHDPRIRDEPARQTPRQLVLELGMILEMARRAVVAHEPAPQPHQRRASPRHLQIAHLAPAGVVHPYAAEPARRAARPPHRRLDLHPQLARRV